MSRRLRQRREAIESRYVAMHSDGDDEADWEDADFDSLAVYREAGSLADGRLQSPRTVKRSNVPRAPSSQRRRG